MPLMNAVQVAGPGADLELIRTEIPEPGEREVLLKVEACGVCRGDAIPVHGRYPGLSYPRVPGHEVVGVVTKRGAGVSGWDVGARVGGHCMVCEACAQGDYQSCEDSLVTGLSVDGGYAEYMVARSSALVSIPDELSSVDAAPLLCAGATTFSALRHSGAAGGDTVAVHGIGGLGHLALQYASRLGYRTVALSRGPAKEKLARELGAHIYIDTDATDAAAALQELGGARVILCTAPNVEAIAGLINGLGMDGQLIIVAGLSEPLSFYPGQLFRGGRSIKGWHGQRPADAVAFSMRFSIMPMIETFPLERAAEAFEKMMSATVRFRSVLTMGT
ncbi:MAG TPA: alcohol dehydrogenase catalytic domain-containing protein [Thermoleophilia bacterium]|nr:alcohol dehydrogenase catalytic domain-containing protein [Thermoleophilia bacterium]